MRDFTSKTYILLLESIRNAGYSFQTVEHFLEKPTDKVVVLRHDSDIWPGHDLNLARIESSYNIKTTYYFRIPHTFNLEVIKKVCDLGHEIGYHYENLADTKGDYTKAIASFQNNLEKIRKIYPVRTVAMHGRPLSKWDSRKLWGKYSLKDFGLIGEPYLSIDYNTVLYLTDNGSRWDGERMSIRDTVNSNFDYSFRTTFQLIEAFKNDKLPKQIIINAHAARWNDNLGIWVYRYFLQKAKNIAKYFLKTFFH
jgi:hypothetical protein